MSQSYTRPNGIDLSGIDDSAEVAEISKGREISPFASVPHLLLEHPERVGVFQRRNLPFCCGEQALTVLQACARSGVDYRTVLFELLEGEGEVIQVSGCALDPGRIAGMPDRDLIDHLQAVHHTYLQQGIPKLTYLMELVANRHGTEFPKLWMLRALVQRLSTQISASIVKESALFARLDQLNACGDFAISKQTDASPTAENVAAVDDILEEHEMSRRTVAEMRALTGNFSAPATACDAHRHLLRGLGAIADDLPQYFQEEESGLFPRVMRRRIAV